MRIIFHATTPTFRFAGPAAIGGAVIGVIILNERSSRSSVEAPAREKPSPQRAAKSSNPEAIASLSKMVVKLATGPASEQRKWAQAIYSDLKAYLTGKPGNPAMKALLLQLTSPVEGGVIGDAIVGLRKTPGFESHAKALLKLVVQRGERRANAYADMAAYNAKG